MSEVEEWVATVEVTTDEEVEFFLDDFVEYLSTGIPWKGVVIPEVRSELPGVAIGYGLEADGPQDAKQLSEKYIIEFLGEFGMRYTEVKCIAVENARDPDSLYSFLE